MLSNQWLQMVQLVQCSYINYYVYRTIYLFGVVAAQDIFII